MFADITQFEALMKQSSSLPVTNGWKRSLAHMGLGAGMALTAPWLIHGYKDARNLATQEQAGVQQAAQYMQHLGTSDDELGVSQFNPQEVIERTYGAAGAPNAELREFLKELRTQYPTIYSTMCSDSSVASKRFEFVKKHREDFTMLLQNQKSNPGAYNVAMWQLRKGTREQQDIALLLAQSPTFVIESLQLVASKPNATSEILKNLNPDAIKAFEDVGEQLRATASSIRTHGQQTLEQTQQLIKDGRKGLSLPARIIHSLLPNKVKTHQ